MVADRFWELLSKQAFAEANEVELKEFEQILSENTHLKSIAESMNALSHQFLPLLPNEDAEIAFTNHLRRAKEAGVEFHEPYGMDDVAALPGGPVRRSRRWLRTGTIVLGVLSCGLVLFFLFQNKLMNHPAMEGASKRSLNVVATKPASKSRVQLPDGSTVWLNASSDLTYDKDFGKEIREVNLTGEGFFDVVKDAAHPFIIHTKVIDVKVLGTEFNVRAYPNDAYTETSLIRGSVEITVKNRPQEKHYLEPNEKMSVANNILDEQPIRTAKSEPIILMQPLTHYPSDSSVVETSWLSNMLIFQQNETFREVALKMERWYGVHINFDYQQAADEYRPFASFKNENVRQALDALREGYRFNYRVDGDTITITQ